MDINKDYRNLSIYLSIRLGLQMYLLDMCSGSLLGTFFIVRYTLLGIGFDDKDYLITLEYT